MNRVDGAAAPRPSSAIVPWRDHAASGLMSKAIVVERAGSAMRKTYVTPAAVASARSGSGVTRSTVTPAR
ncbi:MAG: hypothetical protein WKG32_20145 [Gemmatimonadaceae bacterium]